MIRVWMAGVATAGLLAATGALAQDEQPMEGPPPNHNETTTTTTTTWSVRPEERTVIHRYIEKERVKPVEVHESLAVGVPVPPDVDLQPVPEEIYTSVPEARRYQYFDWNGRMVFVDPDTRKVVQIVD
ncbi:MAG TPA: DUF1236 domain-containing protein [Rhizomicrobium sp.]|jgi:hypothetical protein